MTLQTGAVCAPPPPSDPKPLARPLPLLDTYLAAQQELSAVERFSQLHEHGTAPLQEPYYRSLMPASPPAEGQQYSFAVPAARPASPPATA